MKQESVIHNTFVIERSFSKTPAQVFAAFSDPAQKLRWYGQSENHDVEKFEMEFQVGGAEHVQYRFREGTPFPGVALTNDGRYLDIVPGSRIIMESAMAIGGKNVSAVLATFEFLATAQGTTLVFTHQGAFLEGSGGPEMREQGWRKLLDKLAAVLV